MTPSHSPGPACTCIWCSSSEAQPTPLLAPDTGQETSGGSCRGVEVRESRRTWRRRTWESREGDLGLPATFCTCGQGWAGALAGHILQKRVEWGRPRGTHAWIASVTQTIWLTFSSRQLQAFSSTARSVAWGWSLSRSSPCLDPPHWL